jgi:hypothetical protein
LTGCSASTRKGNLGKIELLQWQMSSNCRYSWKTDERPMVGCYAICYLRSYARVAISIQVCSAMLSDVLEIRS